MTELVKAGRLRFPAEVFKELKRYAGAENPALDWAAENLAIASQPAPGFDVIQAVLGAVPEVLDPDKEGEDEADPYLLAMASIVDDARIITEEFKTTGSKMCLAGAAGFLAIPAVSLRVFLKFEEIVEWK
jgi:hypothetical protein